MTASNGVSAVGDLYRRVRRHRRRAELSPQVLVDDHPGCQAQLVAFGEPLSLDEFGAVHDSVVRVHEGEIAVAHAVQGLHPHPEPIRAAGVADAIAFGCPEEGGSQLLRRGNRAGVQVVDVHGDMGRPAGLSLERLRLGLLHDRTSRHDGRESGHGDAHADEREQHARAVDAELLPCFVDRPDEPRPQPHDPAPSRASGVAGGRTAGALNPARLPDSASNRTPRSRR